MRRERRGGGGRELLNEGGGAGEDGEQRLFPFTECYADAPQPALKGTCLSKRAVRWGAFHSLCKSSAGVGFTSLAALHATPLLCPSLTCVHCKTGSLHKAAPLMCPDDHLDRHCGCHVVSDLLILPLSASSSSGHGACARVLRRAI